MKTPIQNPILPGFNPDPCLCRVGDDFYIATSTFEWFPGVQIYHSRDLRHWKLIHRPLNEKRLLDLEGVQSSAGVWAPCLTWHDGLFYLVYTVVKTWRGETPVDWGAFKDTPNYLTTAPTLTGPWSDPVYLNSSGFDPSLFHDDDGRSWLVNMEWNPWSRPSPFTGILLQEFDRKTQRLVGPVQKIFTGSPIGRTEGPHLYKRQGWYYLLTAEGGTSYEHAVTLARSRSIEGPYEIQPGIPVCTADSSPETLGGIYAEPQVFPEGFHHRIQKAGHGSWAPLEGDEAVLVHLCGRPYPGTLICHLGRETALQKAVWKDGWLRLIDGQGQVTNQAQNHVDWERNLPPTPDPWTEAPYLAPLENGQRRNWSFRDDFDGPVWHREFRSLRIPLDHHADLKSRPGHLRLTGQESPVSPFRQTVLAASIKNTKAVLETCMEFQPSSFQQMAGLIIRYDERNLHYLFQSRDPETNQVMLGVLSLIRGKLRFPQPDEMAYPVEGEIRLKAEIDGLNLRFFWGSPQGASQPVGGSLDLSSLSDEGAWPMGFTGLFGGLACHDLTGSGKNADFDWFVYQELPH